MNYDLGETDYRRAGLERLAEADILYKREMFAGCVYLAGRAVESMLRALIWKFDAEVRTGKKSLETGHDLRRLLMLVNELGIVTDQEHRDELAKNVQRIGRLWFNNMRFFPTARMKTIWWKIRETGKRRSLKQAVADYYKMCSDIVNRC